MVLDTKVRERQKGQVAALLIHEAAVLALVAGAV